MLSESATVNGVKVEVSGGGLATSLNNISNKYSINVRCGKDTMLTGFIAVYTGPITMSSIWDKDGGIGGKDNTGKMFSISSDKAKSLVSQMSSGSSVIKTEGEGTIKGITGKCFVTLTKK